jgi:hypothetical protein
MPRVALHAYDANDYIAARAAYAKILWLRGYPYDAKTEAEQCIAEALEAGQEQSIRWAIVPDARLLARRGPQVKGI